MGHAEQIIEKLRARRELLDHPIDLCATFGVGDMSREDTAAGIKLFGEKVLPVIQSWDRIGAERSRRLPRLSRRRRTGRR